MLTPDWLIGRLLRLLRFTLVPQGSLIPLKLSKTKIILVMYGGRADRRSAVHFKGSEKTYLFDRKTVYVAVTLMF